MELIIKTYYDKINLHNKYIVTWSELEDSSHINPYLCVLFLREKLMDKYFNKAIKEAIKSYRNNEVPVGAIIVKNDQIISKGHNDRQKKYNVLGHAEIISIVKASKKIKDWRLDDCEMFVTLEPCEMCQKIIDECRIKKIYYLIKGKENTKNDQKYENISVNSILYNY